MNKGHSLSYTHLILHSHDNPNDLFPASTLPRGWSGENLKPALLPPPTFARGGARGVAGWVLPCPSSLLPRGWGWGARDSLTNDKSNLFYVLFMFPRPFIPNFSLYLILTAIALVNSKRPVPTPHTGSSCGRKDEIIRNVNDS
jgi:hypothetical protein